MSKAMRARFRPLFSHSRHGGFTLIELAVTVCIIAVLVTVLLQRILYYRDQAERVAMEQVVGSLRSALHLQLALLLVRNRDHELLHLAEQNPMDWLAEKPPNYLGELYGPKVVELEKGNWYYDRKDRHLVYLIAGTRAFGVTQEDGVESAFAKTGDMLSSSTAGKREYNQVYLKVNLLRANSGNTSGQRSGLDGVVLEQIGP